MRWRARDGPGGGSTTGQSLDQREYNAKSRVVRTRRGRASSFNPSALRSESRPSQRPPPLGEQQRPERDASKDYLDVRVSMENAVIGSDYRIKNVDRYFLGRSCPEGCGSVFRGGSASDVICTNQHSSA
jgi:hypothetical protein